VATRSSCRCLALLLSHVVCGLHLAKCHDIILAAQLGKQRTAKQQNPTLALSYAIANVLELSKLYPKLDVRQLLGSTVTMVQLNLSFEKARADAAPAA